MPRTFPVIDNIAALKTMSIKTGSSKSFDTKITERLIVRENILKKKKSSILDIDWKLDKEKLKPKTAKANFLESFKTWNYNKIRNNM